MSQRKKRVSITKLILDYMDSEKTKQRIEEDRQLREAAKSSPEYIRDEKMRKLLQHNAQFQKDHKKTEPTIEEYETECRYLADSLLKLITADLEDKAQNIENAKEIINYYKTNFKFIFTYSSIISKEKQDVNIIVELFNDLISLNPNFLCFAPIICLLQPDLPIDKIDEDVRKSYLLPRIEKFNLLNSKSFSSLYGKYFTFNNMI